jgi:hypothetical protein
MLTLVPIAPPISIAQLGATDWETSTATTGEITHGKIDCLPRQRVAVVISQDASARRNRIGNVVRFRSSRNS